MADTHHQRIQDLFHAASARPSEQREAYLRRECAEPELIDEVMSLLEHLDTALPDLGASSLTFMEWTDSSALSTIDENGARASQDSEISFAGYEIIERIGEGGMGIVFAAMQERPRRKVALKVIRGGAANAALRKRLRLEAELLGRLKHPGIAQVFEAGEVSTALGTQPFIAMELVEGLDLLTHADHHRLALQERIALIIKMSEAVHHAHMHGIIHRDIKPGNVIVEPNGQPKVLDFGIARIDDDELRHESLHTQAGQVVGTLNYMSPEQAEGHSDGVDTRADVYALGAVAFELLSGRPVRDLSGAPLSEALHRVRNDPPPSLSQWNRNCRGDLDIIVTKAMAVDKQARYASASEFASDLYRVLRHEPIQARPPSARYQIRMLARRHRALVLSLIGIFLALIAGLATTLWQASEAKEANRVAHLAQSHAESEARTAEEIILFLTQDVIAAAHPDRLGAKATIKEAILEARARAMQRISDPGVLFRVHKMLGETLNGLSLLPEAMEDYRLAYDLKCKSEGTGSDKALSTLIKIAEVQEKMGQFTESIATSRDVLQRIKENPSATAGTHAFALSTLAWALRQVGESEAAFAHASEALAILNAISKDPTEAKAVALNDLAILFQDRNDLKTAESMMRQSLEIRRQLHGNGHSSVAQSLNNLGLLLQSKGLNRDSAEVLRESIQIWKGLGVETSRRVAITTMNLYHALERTLTKDQEAYEVAQRAQTMAQQCLRPQHPMQIRTLTCLAESLSNLGRFEEALIPAQKALALCRSPGRRSPTLLAPALWSSGQALSETGSLKKGERLLREALKDCETKVRHRVSRTVIVKTFLASNLVQQKRYKEAESLLLDTLEPIRKGLTTARNNLMSAKAHLKALYTQWGHPERLAEVNLP